MNMIDSVDAALTRSACAHPQKALQSRAANNCLMRCQAVWLHLLGGACGVDVQRPQRRWYSRAAVPWRSWIDGATVQCGVRRRRVHAVADGGMLSSYVQARRDPACGGRWLLRLVQMRDCCQSYYLAACVFVWVLSAGL
jgi:hypothetical protein